jgi:hypothetical protein
MNPSHRKLLDPNPMRSKSQQEPRAVTRARAMQTECCLCAMGAIEHSSGLSPWRGPRGCSSIIRTSLKPSYQKRKEVPSHTIGSNRIYLRANGHGSWRDCLRQPSLELSLNLGDRRDQAAAG